MCQMRYKYVISTRRCALTNCHNKQTIKTNKILKYAAHKDKRASFKTVISQQVKPLTPLTKALPHLSSSLRVLVLSQ